MRKGVTIGIAAAIILLLVAGYFILGDDKKGVDIDSNNIIANKHVIDENANSASSENYTANVNAGSSTNSNAASSESSGESQLKLERRLYANSGGKLVYNENGLAMFLYFPNSGSLKGDEAEIMAFNDGNTNAQFLSTGINYYVSGKLAGLNSGTWEKFPDFQSWNRIEYIGINAPHYKGEPLIISKGQKGKIHYHYKFDGFSNAEQKADIDLKIKIGEKIVDFKKIVVRDDGGGAGSSGSVNAGSTGGEEGH